MNVDAVVGCSSVFAEPGWLKLRTATGAVRTIPWDTVKLAGMGGNHEGHMKLERVTEKVTPFFASHDSLWIIIEDRSLAQVMIEKTGPKRDEVLAAFARYLGERWRGDSLTMKDLTEEMFKLPAAVNMPGPGQMPMIVMWIAIGLGVLASVLAMVLMRQ
ncbi:MAG TPA: hypothetical protein VMT15_01155 [Bryobacteraceae bacterium]|nr:hypothetical protein [Bryobacteraceae bacterium]